ncbi:DUF3592 domain-containing protein [Actinomadura sp. CNU-125]|uniref:DUF3592 domain-containing protein n=1 Tax=Actinomadura sp. CNU-125 TaxID=1904961 RepID=UPI0011786987|nr:DUF3592 domain-containing protein [Actinomadura sp. CNU-125]
MQTDKKRRYRPSYIGCVIVAVVMGLLSVTWGGGAIAAWVDQSGKTRATARVLGTDGNRSSGRITVEFTTADGRRIDAEDGRRGWPRDAEQGDEVDVLYDADDPAGGVQPYQDLGRSLPWWALFTVTAFVAGFAAYRTRPRA